MLVKVILSQNVKYITLGSTANQSIQIYPPIRIGYSDDVTRRHVTVKSNQLMDF